VIDIPGWRRIRTAWGVARPRGRVAIAVATLVAGALIGTFLFGMWHVAVGGILKGNWNAGGFGLALASVSGVLLWIDAIVLRRATRRVAD
jgi:hypothetical protein